MGRGQRRAAFYSRFERPYRVAPQHVMRVGAGAPSHGRSPGDHSTERALPLRLVAWATRV